MILRNARKEEAESCYRCIEDARAYHKELGFEQWHADYPTLQTIEEDIAAGSGYVFEAEGRVLGYCCIFVGEEPAYREIEGAWKTDRSYAVIHRMAFSASGRGGGLSKEAFSLLRDFCRNAGIDAIRADTAMENKVMQHILSREGFAYCGLIHFQGGPKLAYEWDREAPAFVDKQ